MVNKIEHFDSRWLAAKPFRVLARIKALAERRGCWVRVWENPCGREGVLFWIETYAGEGAEGRAESFRADWMADPELKKWFLFESLGRKP